MDGTVPAFDFQLAEHLGLTLGQVRDLPNAEWIAWRAYLSWKAAMADMTEGEG